MKKIDSPTRFLLLSMFLMCALLPTHAAPVSVADAELAARHFWNLRHSKDTAPLDAPMQLVETPFDGMYLFAADGNGFVLMAADDCLRPVLGYSFRNAALDSRGLNPELSYWLSSLQRQVQYARANGLKATPAIADAWQQLLTGKDGEAPATSVGPLMTTLWDQDEPYNNLCPTRYGTRTVTGCVATAMAQVMRFWSHPLRGTGSHSYSYSSSRFSSQTLSADFGATEYDWQHMPDQPTPLSSSAEINAVATLMYHCGVAIDMEYATAYEGGSGAMFSPAPVLFYRNALNAFIEHFGYSSNTVSCARKFYSDSAWTALVRGELDAGHPILYAGADGNEGGHCFVCDGYDDQGLYHFNWGWSGSGDGFYALDALNPGSGGAGGGTYHFSDDQEILVGLQPANPALDDSLCIIRHFPYAIDFDLTAPSCWWAEDLDGEGMSWIAFDTTGVLGNRSAIAMAPYYVETANDVLHLPLIATPGRYTLSWEDRAMQRNSQEPYSVALGDSVLFSASQPYTTWTAHSVDFAVADTAHIAITYRGTRSNSHALMLDNFVIAAADVQSIPHADATPRARLFPNPTSGIVSIESPYPVASAELFDAFGRRIASLPVFSGSLDLSPLPAGVYILRLLAPEASETLRVVKQ
ncbi:MAG: thiol protease/hemagglutinin PrtT [Bacteroidales bacterium]|nr:thiol protease/hemagglutinin PrtT [Bacteroidales bacterium]